MKIVFVSENEEFIQCCKKAKYRTFLGSPKDYVPSLACSNVYYISPSNSLCFMDAGINKIYTEMFPNIERDVVSKISKLGYLTSLGRYYLPIGKAIATECESYTQGHRNFIITSPCMLLPQNVSGTENAFYCMTAVLQLLQKYKQHVQRDDELIVPDICVNYGGMSCEQSFQQIIKALKKQKETNPLNYNDILFQQPKILMNTEFGIRLL